VWDIRMASLGIYTLKCGMCHDEHSMLVALVPIGVTCETVGAAC